MTHPPHDVTDQSVQPVPTYTSFDGHRRIAAGPLSAVALVVKRALARQATGPVLIFDDATGKQLDIDTRSTDEDVLARLGPPAHRAPRAAPDAASAAAAEPEPAAEPRGRGRPRLGVVAREVTLLPRHWDWLAAQPGGASVALRKLVDTARKANADQARLRQAQERAYHFMQAIAGDLPGYEEATRALFANDAARFSALLAPWPADVREHAERLAFGDHGAASQG